jgi:hypothetical protein
VIHELTAIFNGHHLQINSPVINAAICGALNVEPGMDVFGFHYKG